MIDREIKKPYFKVVLCLIPYTVNTIPCSSYPTATAHCTLQSVPTIDKQTYIYSTYTLFIY